MVIESWRNHYNTVRPHSSLGYAGREDEVITFETEDGLVLMTVRQMLDEFEGDEADFEALKVCVG